MENTYTLDAIWPKVSTQIVIVSLPLGSIGLAATWEGKKWKIKLFWNIFLCHSLVPLLLSSIIFIWTQSPKNATYKKTLVFLGAIPSLTPKQLDRKMKELTSPFPVFMSPRCWFNNLIFFHLEKETRLMRFFSFPKFYSICFNGSFCDKHFCFINTCIYSLRTTEENRQTAPKIHENQ